MNLFNYLMNKKDKKIVDSEHLLEYLLNRGRLTSQSGTTISIDTQKTKINKLILSKESSQATSTYKGLLKIPKSLSQTKNGLTFVVNDDNSVTITGTSTASTSIDVLLETPLILDGTYTFSLKTVGTISSAQQQQWILYPLSTLNPTVESNKTNKVTRTLSNLTINSLRVYTTANRTLDCTIYPILEEGGTVTDWDDMPTNNVPNTIYPQPINTVTGDITLTIAGSEDNNEYTISLGDNEMVGKLNVLDELIIDKKGHCYFNKKFDKIDSYDGEVITTDYWSTTGGLDTGATIYYVLEEPVLIDLDIDIDIELFKGSNTITNSASANMKLYYYE